MTVRALLVALFSLGLVASACNSGDPDPTEPGVDAADNSDLPVPTSGFQIRTPDLQLAAGEEATYCYYTRLPNTTDVGITRWQSRMSPGSHHMILYFTATELQPAGSLTKAGCGAIGSINNIPVWTYAAQSSEASADMPPGVGMTVPAGQPAYIQMHYLNTSDAPITVHVTLNGEAYPEGQPYTKAAAFVTYNTQIDLAPNSSGSATGTCDVPAGARFFALSTHAHKQAVLTRVTDGAATVFESTDWEHPAGKQWTDPYYTFTTGQLTYHCDYVNPTGNQIRTGPSAQTDEMCMAIGYYFPADSSKLCVNNAVIN